MKNRRLLAWTFSCLFVVAGPGAVLAQTDGGGATTGGATTGGGGGGGGGGQGIGSGGQIGASNANNVTTRGLTAATVYSITSGTGSATSTPSNTNPFVSTYADYLSWGMPSKYATTFGPLAKPTVTFGKGIYTTTATTGAAGGATTAASQTASFSTFDGKPRNPQYTTVLSEDIPIKVHAASELLLEVKDVIARSEKLKSKNAIQVTVDGNTILLSGQVATDRERQLVEAMVSMTPGVRSVQNTLTVELKK